MFQKLRMIILLALLAFVAANTWLDRFYSHSWKGPLQVALFPINGDGSASAAQFMQGLSQAELTELETFFATQAERHRLKIDRPLRFSWAPPLAAAPPLPPQTNSRMAIMQWSLKLRWFTWRTVDPPGPTPTIRLFVLFHDPQRATVLPHSTGLEKGLVGIAHVFASPDMKRANLVVIAHEVLHTVGATDKYDLQTNLPIYPQGYADPEQMPRYPQERAELMAGRIALSSHEAEQPWSLRQAMIGPATAREIGWSSEATP